jgi:hypothetical protein
VIASKTFLLGEAFQETGRWGSSKRRKKRHKRCRLGALRRALLYVVNDFADSTRRRASAADSGARAISRIAFE